MKILVTGGAGFIGSHVCEALLARGDSVICLDNFNDYYDPKVKEENIKECLKNSSFSLIRPDITDYGELARIFDKNKIDKIIHLAARAGVRDSLTNPFIYEQVNVKGTLNLLELAKNHDVKKFVFGSSSSVYGLNKKVPFSEGDNVDDIISIYGSTKRAAELLCKNYNQLFGLNVCCLRFFTVYGPRGRPDMAVHKFTRLINEGKEIPVFGDGHSKRDYTFVSDIVAGVLAALDKELGFEIINLGDSNSIELKYLISLIEENLGKRAKIKNMEMQPGDVPITFADISQAKRLLAYEPKVKIEEGIKRFVEWYRR